MITQLQQDIAEFLIGTCKAECDAVHAFEEHDVTDEDVLDAIIATEIDLCALCGWWHEGFELEVVDDDLVCDECRAEQGEDE